MNKYLGVLTIVMCLIGCLLAHAGSVSVIDNSDFSVTAQSTPVTTNYSITALTQDYQRLQTLDATWQYRLQQDAVNEANDTTLINEGQTAISAQVSQAQSAQINGV